MGKQVFEADGQVLGSREIPNFLNLPGIAIRPHYSYAYFCCRCGEIWGRLRHEGAAYTQCIYRNCRAHGDGRLAMTFPSDREPIGISFDWPREALLREFLVELETAER